MCRTSWRSAWVRLSWDFPHGASFLGGFLKHCGMAEVEGLHLIEEEACTSRLWIHTASLLFWNTPGPCFEALVPQVGRREEPRHAVLHGPRPCRSCVTPPPAPSYCPLWFDLPSLAPLFSTWLSRWNLFCDLILKLLTIKAGRVHPKLKILG